jgi:hypothetical protein
MLYFEIVCIFWKCYSTLYSGNFSSTFGSEIVLVAQWLFCKKSLRISRRAPNRAADRVLRRPSKRAKDTWVCTVIVRWLKHMGRRNQQDTVVGGRVHGNIKGGKKQNWTGLHATKCIREGSKDRVSNCYNLLQPHSEADSRIEVKITCYTDHNKTQYRDKIHKSSRRCRCTMVKRKKIYQAPSTSVYVTHTTMAMYCGL